MKSISVALLKLFTLIACVTFAGWSQNGPNTDPSGKHVMKTRLHSPAPDGGVRPTTIIGNGIIYHGGPLMLGTVNVYYIWYGNWSGAAALSGMNVLQNLASHFTGSTYYNINTTYYDGTLAPISNSVHFAGSTFDNYSQGTALDDEGVDTVVTLAIGSGKLPNDPNGVYFVLTSADVNEITGFCNVYCGWHNHDSSSGTDIKFSFVGNANACLSACSAQNPSPNGDAGIDAMANIIAHELSEAVTDPDLNAWYDQNGNEMADLCAWVFGPTFTVGNFDQQANVTLGGLNYLLQELWVNETGGFCGLSYGTPAPAITLTSVAPASGLQGAIVPVTLTGAGFPANATVNVNGSGIVVSNVVVTGTTTISANFNIANNAALGSYNVTVTGNNQTTLARTFTVTSLTPTLTSISPSSGAPGTNVPLTLTGTNFVSPASIIVSGSGVTAASVTVVSSTQITATLQIANGAGLGIRSVSVQTNNGTSGTANFTVAQPSPTLTLLSPSSAGLSTSNPVTLTGTNFLSPATINIAGAGVTASGVSVASSTQISATFTVSSTATTGAHNVTVSMSNGTTNALTFTVNPPSGGGGGGGGGSPSLSGISPSSGKAGTSIKVTLTGSNLAGLSAIPIQITGNGISITSVTPVGTGGTAISATFTIAATATKSTRFVSVKSANGSASNTVQFTVQ